jgi:hypothetical protein
MSQVLGVFGMLGFTMSHTPFSLAVRLLTYEQFISFIFQSFFRAVVNRG